MRTMAEQLPAEAWTRYRLRDGSRGPEYADFAIRRVVDSRSGLPDPDVWLVMRDVSRLHSETLSQIRFSIARQRFRPSDSEPIAGTLRPGHPAWMERSDRTRDPA